MTPLGDTYEWAETTYCKCPHCGGLDVSYVGDDLDICGTCHGKFTCRRPSTALDDLNITTGEATHAT